MTFRPINDDHAVERCEFAIGLNAPLSPRETNLIHSRAALWCEELPAITVSELDVPTDPVAQFIIGPNNVGLLFSYLRPDGSAVWSMQCGFNEILITATRYTRWATTWSVAQTLIAKVLSVLQNPQNPRQVISVALRVRDEFYAAAGHQASSALVQSKFVSGLVLAQDSTWHNNLGWFEPISDSPVLNHLNISTRNDTFGDEARRSLQISHLQQIRLEDADRPPLIADQSAAAAAVDAIELMMTELHIRNKRVMTELLTPELASRIGLRGNP